MSQQETMTLKKFQERFDSEQTCHDHMFQIRWPKGFLVPNVKVIHTIFCRRESFTSV